MSTIPPTSTAGTEPTDGEHIGPLPLGVSPPSLRERFLAEIRKSLADAQHAADQAETDPTGGVHEYRKALRRTRALVTLVQGTVPRSEYKTIVEALREARRALSPTRDHTVAPAVLDGLDLPADQRVVVNEIIASARASIPPLTDDLATLQNGARRALAQYDALESALPNLGPKSLLHGVSQTYREARIARRKAKRSLPQFHRFRRRLKELSYQLEFVAQLGGARTTAMRDAYIGVSDACGDIADLLMVREFLATFQGASAQHAYDAVVARLREEIEAGALAQRKASRDLFGWRAKDFRRKLRRALRKDDAASQSADVASLDTAPVAAANDIANASSIDAEADTSEA